MSDLENGRFNSKISEGFSGYQKATVNQKSGSSEILKNVDPVRIRSNPVLSFGEELDAIISEKSREHGVDERLIRAVIDTESRGKADAVSPKGAVGLMQLMPSTAKRLGVNPENPEENVDGGIRYLKDMAGKFDSLDEVLAAYNAGPGAVKRYNGVPPYQETQDYVRKVRSRLADFHM
jgi:soluble lytic murein transglycosylase-like protein